MGRLTSFLVAPAPLTTGDSFESWLLTPSTVLPVFVSVCSENGVSSVEGELCASPLVGGVSE